MHLREAMARDALLISQIIARSWRGAYGTLIDPVYLSRLPEEYWLPSMRAWLESGRMYGFIAVENDTPVGCVICGRGRDEDHADWGEIVSLYVLPDRMGSGIGSSLLRTALDALQADGYDQVYLWCIDGNQQADRFYQHHGFIPTADRVDYRIGSSTVTDIRYILEVWHG
jgi:ribosomal protein S18 acetylase RimI-like enzyme